MERLIDLHIHTTASDGSCTPGEVVALAHQAGLAAIAITDHDTMAGVSEARAAGAELGVEVLPGMEVSTDYLGRDAHVLGYGMDPAAPELRRVLDFAREDRHERNERIARLMRKDGVDISLAQLERENPGATIGRPHLAQVLVAQHRADSVSDAFGRLLGVGCPYYLPRRYLPMQEAIQVIRGCGGVAVLAHPLSYGYDASQLCALVQYARAVGVSGLESRYTGYTPAQTAQLEALAAEFGLLCTGGSDFHGANKPEIALGRGLGNLAVPAALLSGLKARIKEAGI